MTTETPKRQHPLYKALASLIQARINYEKAIPCNDEWLGRRAQNLTREHMPSGSGIDTGCTLLFEESNGERLVFSFSFHHMDENGMYDGWTDHKLIVTPSLLSGFDLKITGRNRRGIKEDLYETFHTALETLVEY